ncbi:Sterol biosynthesis ERG24/DHCR-like - like 1 [Theobroma cacao]|nr:Sterol biosynthesis ERG24/DHCR-like - like 1 [Theobroma cacao]
MDLRTDSLDCYPLGQEQGWWLLNSKVELTSSAIANCFVFLIGYLVFRGANKQKHIFKKNPEALIYGVSLQRLFGGKLLASGYWGIARHSEYLGDLLLALSFRLLCEISSPIPYFYPICLLFCWYGEMKPAVLRRTKKENALFALLSISYSKPGDGHFCLLYLMEMKSVKSRNAVMQCHYDTRLCSSLPFSSSPSSLMSVEQPQSTSNLKEMRDGGRRDANLWFDFQDMRNFIPRVNSTPSSPRTCGSTLSNISQC